MPGSLNVAIIIILQYHRNHGFLCFSSQLCVPIPSKAAVLAFQGEGHVPEHSHLPGLPPVQPIIPWGEKRGANLFLPLLHNLILYICPVASRPSCPLWSSIFSTLQKELLAGSLILKEFRKIYFLFMA